MSKKVIHLTENDLKQIVNQSVYSVISENTQNEIFGINTRARNRVNTFKYARLYKDLVAQVEAIANEIYRRTQILDSLEQSQNQGQNDAPQNINEVAGLVGTFIKGAGKFATKYGLRKGLTTAAKVAARAGGKTALKRAGTAALVGIVAELVGIPQAIGKKIEQFKNPAQNTPEDVIQAYGELAQWMQELCQIVQERPDILGAEALSQESQNGPQDPKSGPFMSGYDVVSLAGQLGLCALGPVGMAASAVWLVFDVADSLFSAKARADEEGLKMVEQQYKYLTAAIKDMNIALEKTKSPQAVQQAIAQQGQNPQQLSQQGQMPQNYKMGQPAPFASNDPQQVARFQSYVGVPVTGKWDSPTQKAWNEWLFDTYGQSQPAMQQATALSENEFKSFVKKIIAESLQ